MPLSRSFTVFSFICLCLFVALGTWQVHRREQKEEILKVIEQAQHRPALNVDTLTTYIFPQPLQAEGHFLPEKSAVLSARPHQGKLGVYVLDVFQTKGGHFLLVQRGWAKIPPKSPPTYPLKITGIGRMPSPPSYFQPKNTPPTYYGIDLKLLSRELSVPLLPYYMIAHTSEDPLVLPTDPLPHPPNNHLQYALTWYALAFFMVGVLWYRKYYTSERIARDSQNDDA